MLEGIVVVEFGRIYSAPLCGMLLSDLGAKVIKVERKSVGDESRHYGTKLKNGESDYFFALNRNKEIISLDLKEEQDLEVAMGLLQKADVLIHNSLQGSFDKLGLSYDAVRKINPQIIYTAISGYGASSTYRNSPSQDVIIQGLSGFMSLNGYVDDMPLKTGVPVIDYITGQNATVGILSSLVERTKTGQGKLVNVSLLESALSLVSVEAVRYLNTGVIATRNGNRHTSIAPYNSFKTLDSYVLLAIANDAMFERFCQVLGMDMSGYETNQKRLEHVESLEMTIREKTMTYQTADLIRVLKENKIPAGVINDLNQSFLSDEIGQLDLIGEVDGFKFIKSPIHIM